MPKPAAPRAAAPGLGINTSTGHTSNTGASVLKRGRKPSSGANLIFFLLAGGGLLALLVVLGGAVFISQLMSDGEEVIAEATSAPTQDNPFLAPEEIRPSGNRPLTTGNDDSVRPGAATDAPANSSTFGKPGASWNVFVLDLSDRERQEVQVKIDGQPYPVPELGPVSFQLTAGQHQVQLSRAGFETINHSFHLADNALASYTPRWQREGAGSFTPPTAVAGGPLSFDDWLQDFEEAKRQAHAADKDILVTFNGSDWCGWCIRLMYEVFFQQDFRDRIDRDFVLVQIDSPRKAEGKSRVQDLARNEALARRFGVRGYPTVILTDSEGQAYAQTGYVEGGVGPFLQTIEELKQSRDERDRIFAMVEDVQGEARLEAAKRALEWMKDNEVLQHYGPTLARWLAKALEEDPNNEQGQLEAFFEMDWYSRITMGDRTDFGALKPILDRLTNFNDKYEFQDGDRGARLNLIAASICKMHEQVDQAKKFADAGLACEPEDEELLATLQAATRALAGGDILGSGTGFVVAGGYIMTNHHVIEGEGKPYVRIAGKDEPAPAKIIATDKKLDIALLQVTDPQLVALPPLSVNTFSMGRGSPVGVFGYPLGDDIGSGLKLTTGIVSALPDDANDGMVLLDCRVNPGNSGGPLCDTNGRVIGMVTAKTGGLGVDSYGMARPAEKLEAFLKEHLPNYSSQPPAEPPDAPTWGKIDRTVSSSVLMIVMKKK
jgi:thioredoxin-related protein